jgi:hypothetical protein
VQNLTGGHVEGGEAVGREVRERGTEGAKGSIQVKEEGWSPAPPPLPHPSLNAKGTGPTIVGETRERERERERKRERKREKERERESQVDKEVGTVPGGPTVQRSDRRG